VADRRSDVYSLTATLYHALLYNDRDRREPHCYKGSLVHEAIRPLLTRSLDNDPNERPADAGEFLSVLRQDPAREQRLIGLYEAILDRTQGKLADPDKKTLKDLCREHSIANDRANTILREVRTRWEQRHPVKKEPSAGQVVANGLGMKFAWCPPGSFMMGSPPQEAERGADEAQHRVTISKGFYLGIHTVTQAQWHAVMGSDPSHFKGGDLPVESVSWDECVEFCKKLSKREGTEYRLPTEAEWEYVCRAGTTTPFWFGETIDMKQVNYDGNYPYGKGTKGAYRQTTIAVGSFPPNVWGLHQMHGNVWEWCGDWYGEYSTSENDNTDPQGASSGSARVVRGGGWDDRAGGCRSAYRRGYAPDSRYDFLGFRVARSSVE
jgi:formylglycine-generating enzyme required for sulfatase activity